ncbi:MAG: GNAT family N-acetyltransferase [Anaerolineales bacterium]|nr:GNAT family N-acetyltransferase [Anaerolineales bacterium]
MKTKIYVEVDNMPDIPGLKVRRYIGFEDAKTYAWIKNTAWQADNLDWTYTEEEAVANLQPVPGFNPVEDVFFIEVNNEPIGVIEANWRKRFEGYYSYRTAGVFLPEWNNKGIGTAALAFTENHIFQIAKTHEPAAPKFFMVGFDSRQNQQMTFYENNGYQPYRFFFGMKRPIDLPIKDTPLPEEIEIRPVAPDQVDKIFDAHDEAFEDHWGHVPLTTEDRKKWLAHPSTDISLWVVAWNGDQVAGSILNLIDHEANKQLDRLRGYTEDISVRRPWRKKGLARAMLVYSIQLHKEKGMQETALSVDTENPSGALGFYESMGYAVEDQYNLYKKTLDIK